MPKQAYDRTRKLVPACVSLPPEVFDVVDRKAREAGRPLAHVLRAMIERSLREYEMPTATSSSKL